MYLCCCWSDLKLLLRHPYNRDQQGPRQLWARTCSSPVCFLIKTVIFFSKPSYLYKENVCSFPKFVWTLEKSDPPPPIHKPLVPAAAARASRARRACVDPPASTTDLYPAAARVAAPEQHGQLTFCIHSGHKRLSPSRTHWPQTAAAAGTALGFIVCQCQDLGAALIKVA